MEAPSHSWAYLFRRGLNWVPLGFAYAFFYMGRYNLTVAKRSLGDDLMTMGEFGTIFGIGAIVYGCSFLFTGPMTDKLGGRRAMLLGAAGTIIANFLMGLSLYGMTYWGWTFSVPLVFGILYALNMHFQSYGAIAIVTVKAPWFHLRERGRFSTIFGWMISLGVFFAFDWGGAIAKATRAVVPEELGFWAPIFQAILGTGGTGVDQNWWLFFFPSILIGICWILMFIWLKNSPGEAGYKDFDTGEGSVSSTGDRLPISKVFLKIITHPILLVICFIEFCSGILRNGIMHWYYLFAGKVGFKNEFIITDNWGLSLLCAGVIGAVLTGWFSDKFFQSRRAPMAAILYIVMLLSTVLMAIALDWNPWFAGGAALMVSMAVIGVHGILSGTSTADFAGTKNAGAATGIVDGMVYLGTGIQSFIIPMLLPEGDELKVATNWQWWPIFLIPFTLIGIGLSIKIWNALPKAKPKQA